MYDMEKMKAARVEKNRETTNYRKKMKTQLQAKTSEASGQCIQTCEHCTWKGKDLNKHLGKIKDCQKRYNDDLEECDKNDTWMAHLDEINNTYWERKEKKIESSKKFYSKSMTDKYSKSSFTLMECHYCDWKGKQLSKHLVKKKTCEEKYDADFDECNENGKQMSHLDVYCKYSRRRKIIRKKRKQHYLKRYFKKNKEALKKKAKNYYNNHVSEKKAYDKLRRKMFLIPEDFEGHGPDCFSCKKMNGRDLKKFDCIFCNPMDERFEFYSDREALNEICISSNEPVRKIEGINRIQCTSFGSASCAQKHG